MNTEYVLRILIRNAIRLLEMTNLILFVLSVFLVWNMITFSLFAWDKRRAVKHKRRIPEWVLISCALLGGGMGAYLAMKLFRHKTKKLKFKLFVPLAVLIACIPLVHIAVIIFTMHNG